MKINQQNSQIFDVIIVGAGPAGGQCARALAAAGKKVLLTERNKDFSVNSYSSGGAPLEIMKTFDLPESIIGTYWNKISLYSTDNQKSWDSDKPLGVIFDFMKLRSFLADEMVRQGGVLKLGLSYQKHTDDGNLIKVTFKDMNTKELAQFQTKVLVDASGCERQVLAKSLSKSPTSFSATGIEYLVETSPHFYQKYAQALSLFMGLDWMPQGYAWIFPMSPNQLKMGVGRYFQNENYVPYHKSYHYYLDNLIDKALEGSSPKILDKHGKTIVYTYGLKDVYYDGNVIAIGDAVSSVNPLALEGIRHAMSSGQIAVHHILENLEGKITNFESYQKDMRDYCGFRWKVSEWLMKFIYRQKNDNNINLLVEAFKLFSIDDVMELAFHYKLDKAVKLTTNYAYLNSADTLKKLFK